MSADAVLWVRKLRDLLYETQWAVQGGSDATSWGQCPMCNRADWKGHREGCALHAAIVDVDKWLANHE